MQPVNFQSIFELQRVLTESLRSVQRHLESVARPHSASRRRLQTRDRVQTAPAAKQRS